MHSDGKRFSDVNPWTYIPSRREGTRRRSRELGPHAGLSGSMIPWQLSRHLVRMVGAEILLIHGILRQLVSSSTLEQFRVLCLVPDGIS
jgi:hypothetical protein